MASSTTAVRREARVKSLARRGGRAATIVTLLLLSEITRDEGVRAL